MNKKNSLISQIKRLWELVEEIDEWVHLQKENMERVLGYIPVIWRDRDFDYMFIFSLLRYKLKRMGDAMSVGSPTNQVVASEIKVAIDMLDNVLQKSSSTSDGMQEAIEEFFVYVATNIQGWWE